jgi:hypothetical protein
MTIQEKLEILANAAKYDVSCASSGSRRENRGGGLGNSVSGGICHSFTEDGRCVSLLKILFTNYCIYDCAYCANRSSNDIPRAAFTPSELADLTIDFYRMTTFCLQGWMPKERTTRPAGSCGKPILPPSISPNAATRNCICANCREDIGNTCQRRIEKDECSRFIGPPSSATRG